ncbi:response regulator transcription factor [Caproiciproducens sp. NJN-50]|uniref:response regulator transcription factor n=1 Tax=Acutalibacteraceae TaxID=3082771 RepID=UPI000FFE1D7E|nr:MULTISPECIES: response regulator transcription factor [Acutalibacteraceae]QAT50207.1 response regulator transcription factor [Caproiciproducens sp. NJN-50]
MNANEKRILVVDDEAKIVDVVKSYLERAGYIVLTAYDGREALEKFERESPSLIVLDWMLPDISGEEICRTIRKRSKVPVIMLTARAEEEKVLEGFRFGADDYVAKPFSPRQLVARVGAVLRRSGGGAASVLVFRGGELTIDLEGFEVKKDGRPVSLTPNEFRILSTLARRPKKVFTREELIASAMGGDFEGFDRIIDSHIKNIRQKIETDTKNPRYILTVHGLGYKFGGI